ncbi:MAG: hypothetical protein ACOY32_15815 [Thermodesulfobacteriota bacterium]
MKTHRAPLALLFILALFFFKPAWLCASVHHGQPPAYAAYSDTNGEPTENDTTTTYQDESGALMDEAEGAPGEGEYLPEMEEEQETTGDTGEAYVPDTYDEATVPMDDDALLPEGEAELPEENYLPEMEEAR